MPAPRPRSLRCVEAEGLGEEYPLTRYGHNVCMYLHAGFWLGCVVCPPLRSPCVEPGSQVNYRQCSAVQRSARALQPNATHRDTHRHVNVNP